MTSRNEWRRVSPVAIVYFLFDSLRHALSLWPALVPLLAGGESFRELFLIYGLPGLLLVFSTSVFLHFWFFRFKVESDRIQLHTGVFNRKRLTLYYERVQQADIAQPFYFRPFGLATLGLESAGSGQQEVDIPGLLFHDAEALKDKILEQRRTVEPSVETEGRAQPEANVPDYEIRLPRGEVARYGLMHNGLLFLAPVIAPFMRGLEPFMEDWLPRLEGTLFHEFAVNAADGDLVWLLVILSFLAVLATLAVLFLISMIISLLRFWDYHLVRRSDQYQYRAGLGTVRTRGFRLHKLQQVTITQGVVAKLLKRYSVVISKAGGSGPSPDGKQSKHFLIPVLNEETLGDMKCQLAIPAPHWQRVSPAYIFWRGGAAGLVILLVFVLMAGSTFLFYGALLWALVFLLVWRIWLCLGVFQSDQWLAVKSGFIGQKTTWLPIGKAQKIALNEPPWLKVSRLANLAVWGADGRLELPCIPRASAELIRDQTLYRVVTFRGRWF